MIAISTPTYYVVVAANDMPIVKNLPEMTMKMNQGC